MPIKKLIFTKCLRTCFQIYQHSRPHSLKCHHSLLSVPLEHVRQLDILRLYSKYDPPFTTHHALGVPEPLSEDRAQDLIFNLKDSERIAIKQALDKYDALKVKKGFEGTLAATQWRSRFGRPSRVPALGDVDPTGSFCAFPEDWLKKKAAEKAKEPLSGDLWKIFFVNAVPFIGFGFLDNFTMIIAGDYIEILFGSFMCISTMAAAGLGNTISDILGIGSAFYVERCCEMMGLKSPDLTPVQMEMKSSRRSANYGRIVGITVGCLIGMLPLLFMDNKKKPTDSEEVVPRSQLPAKGSENTVQDSNEKESGNKGVETNENSDATGPNATSKLGDKTSSK